MPHMWESIDPAADSRARDRALMNQKEILEIIRVSADCEFLKRSEGA